VRLVGGAKGKLKDFIVFTIYSVISAFLVTLCSSFYIDRQTQRTEKNKINDP
jgi:hypothetical protein